MLALGVAAGLEHLVCLGSVNPALVGEEQQPVMGGGHEEVLNHIVCTKRCALHALAATVLRAVVVALGALDVATAGERDNHLFFRNQVFFGHVTIEAGNNLRASLVAVLVGNLSQLIADDCALTHRVGENRLVVENQGFELGGFVDNLLTLECRKLTQLHVQNCASLKFINRKQLDQTVTRIFNRCALSNQSDNCVECVECL